MKHWFTLATFVLIVAGIAIQHYTNVWGKLGLP